MSDSSNMVIKSSDLASHLKNDTRVKVSGCDIDGIARGKIMSTEKFLKAAEEGFGFCNVTFGWDMHDKTYDPNVFPNKTRETAYPDILARPDLSSLRRIPWDDNVPHFLLDFYTPDTNKPYPFCPRALLKRVVKQCEKAGYMPFCGMEYEFFNFKETPETLASKQGQDLKQLTPGMFGYSLLRPTLNQSYFNSIYSSCLSYRIPIEGFHTETGPGVYEAALAYTDALEMADRAHLFKTAAKQIGMQYGIMPSFMAKPHSNLPGCSGHIHFSLKSISTKESVFEMKETEDSINKICRQFIAGILTALPSLLPLFAPTVNSYKRLVENYWAPTTTSYGLQNRTSAIRLIPPSRIEFRVPGADVNPYLAIAGCLAAGVWGIENELELKDVPVQRLPGDLKEATIKMLEEGSVARKVLGDEFIEHFGGTRVAEWKEWCGTVTAWERIRYMETV
ncbi:glutamine synthetase [Spizellomyces sp. 'palustris']|nr:glutamine synthetase [Spizellomyces sp. 'palustris']